MYTNIVCLWINGIIITLILVSLSLLLGILLASFFYFIESKTKNLSKIINLFIYIIKGTPMLVQIFIVYHGFSIIFSNINNNMINAFKSPSFSAIFTFSLNSASYMKDLIKNSILAIPDGQYLSAKSLGLSKIRIFKKIIIPQIVRSMLPLYKTEAIILLKSTSLASTITIMDVMAVSNTILAKTYNIIPVLSFTAVCYLFISFLLTCFINFLQNIK